MKKNVFTVVFLLLLVCGCESMMNTPTKRVEEFLNKYQRQDSEVLTQLDEVITDGDFDFTDNQMNSYKELMKNEYFIKNVNWFLTGSIIGANVMNLVEGMTPQNKTASLETTPEPIAIP